jgi:hypothetical protein
MQKIINQLTKTLTFEEEAPLDNLADCFLTSVDCSRLDGAACEPEYIKLTEGKID